MRCRACHADNAPDRGFCGQCGAALPVLCRACGFLNGKEIRFCGGCGRRVGLAGAVNAFLPAVEYTPEHLATRILGSRAAIEGELKLVTVMFVDIRDSFEMISKRDPEQAQAMIDSMLRRMIESVHRYEGTVNQVLGDGFMALFGAPISHEDHAVRAASAAFAIQQALKEAPAGSFGDLGAEAQVRIGLNSGEVAIRAIGNDLSVDYRAIGPTTHMAARMEQIALPGTILLTAETARLAEGLLDVDPLGRLEIKGVSEPVPVFELKGVRSHRTRFGARIDRVSSPFVGRAAEMGELVSSLRRAIDGGLELVVLHGDPGIGKSRLWHELVRSELAGSCLVLEAAPASYTRSTPYSALTGCLRQLFGIAEAETTEAITAKVEARLETLDLSAASLAPVLLGALDVPTADRAWNLLDPAQKRQKIFEAAQALLSRLCERQPVILLWEDLHWFDNESLALLRTIISKPPGKRLLLALTHRPEFEKGLLDGTQHVYRHVDRLSPEDTRDLVTKLVGIDPSLEKLRTLLAERTSGNPFFIEESVRSLADLAVLCGEPGNYRLSASLEGFEIPRTVEAVIAGRIDRLDPDVKEFAQVAAVIGNEIPVDLFRCVTDLPEEVFYERLRSSVRAGILVESQLFPVPIYRFNHSLTHEVVYHSQLKARRAPLHARVVAAMENLYTGRIGEHVDRLAQHAREGELWEKAVDYHQQASVRAATRWANREAIELIDRGLQMLPRLPEGPARSEAAIKLRLAALAPLVPLGEKERIVRLLHEAEAIARSIDDQRLLGAIYSQLATALWLCGDSESALVMGERSLEIAEERDDDALRAAARFNLGVVHNSLANFTQAIEILRGLLGDLSGVLERRRLGWAAYPSVLCRTFLARSLVYVGEFDEALAHLERGCAIADELDHPYSRALIREPLGFYHMTLGRLEAAFEVFELAMRISRAGEVLTMYPAMVGRSAMILAKLGRYDEALQMADDALKQELFRTGGAYTHHWILAAAAAAYAGLGRYEEALTRASELEKLTAGSHERAHFAEALELRGDIHALRGECFSGHAEQAYRSAIEISRDRGMRPMLARCLESLGGLLTARGRSDEAAQHLRKASELYAALGMRAADGSLDALD
jgi:class 3 adenylate cyclase/tetratricopeptide (TPR) repeat protein